MDSDDFKEPKRSKRLRLTENIIKKRERQLKDVGRDYKDSPHKFHKHSPFNCGIPDCHMCANPRKVWKDKTLKEKSFEESMNDE